MSIKLTFPLGAKGIHLDGYVIMKSGMKTFRALQQLAAPEFREQMAHRFSLYHYFPLTNSLGEKKETPPLHHVLGELGGLVESEFKKRGLALVIEDKISTGATLKKAIKYFQQLGYPDEEIWILAEVYYPPPKGEEWGKWDFKLAPLNEFFSR